MNQPPGGKNTVRTMTVKDGAQIADDLDKHIAGLDRQIVEARAQISVLQAQIPALEAERDGYTVVRDKLQGDDEAPLSRPMVTRRSGETADA